MYNNDNDAFFLILLLIAAYFFFRTVFKGESPPNSKPGAAPPKPAAAPPKPPAAQRSDPGMDAATFATVAAGPVRGIFVVVTTAEAQVQLMAMSLSHQVKDKGKSVRVLLCGPAGNLAIKGSPETVLKPIDKSPQMLLKALIAAGITVEVCPFFLPNKGASPSDLIDGVAVAKPPLIADILIEQGIRPFTF